MRVVFIGASNFGLKCLDRVRQLSGIEIVGVITNKQQFSISYAPEGVNNILHADFKNYAKAYAMPVYVMNSKMTEPGLLKNIKSWKPELLIVAGWYHMIQRSLRDLAPTVGLHASLLPNYSGGAPLVWAMINGEKRVGVTLFQLSEGVDNGPIIGQVSTDVLYEDTIATLYERIGVLGMNLLEEYLPKIAAGTVVFIPQDESKRRIFPPRKPENGRIDWNSPASTIYDFIRAQTHPYPGAFTISKGGILRIWESRCILSGFRSDIQPGFVYKLCDNKILVNCGMHTALNLKSVGIGVRDISAEDWFSNFVKDGEGVFA